MKRKLQFSIASLAVLVLVAAGSLFALNAKPELVEQKEFQKYYENGIGIQINL